MGRYYDDFTGFSYARNKRVSRRHRKPSDPRVFSLFLTEEGRNVTKKSRKRVKNVDSDFFQKVLKNKAMLMNLLKELTG